MEFSNKNNKNILFIIFAGILFYVGIENLPSIIGSINWIISLMFPFILGGAIAFIFNVPMRYIEKKLFHKNKIIKSSSLKRVISYLITLLLVICTLLIVMLVVIPELVSTCNTLIKQIPDAYEIVKDYLQSLDNDWPELAKLVNDSHIDFDALSKNLLQMLQDGGMGFLSSTVGIVGGVLSAVTTFFIGFTFSVYVLFQKENLSCQLKKILYAVLPDQVVEKILHIGDLSNSSFSGFLSGQCLEAVILGTMFFFAMSVFQMPYALLMGVLIALTALIPMFGAFIGLFIGTFLILIINPVQAVGFIILFFVLQQIEGNLIYPHVVGGKVGLPSIWVLFAVTIGANLMGIAGMLIFIPICSICYTLIAESVHKRLELRKIPESKWTSEQPVNGNVPENSSQTVKTVKKH